MDKGEKASPFSSIFSRFWHSSISSIPFLTIDGVFGDETQAAVQALQLDAGLPQTGTVDEETWDVIIDRFIGIDRTVLSNPKFSLTKVPLLEKSSQSSFIPIFCPGPVSSLAFPWNWGQ